jgi:hypothetical protein
MLKRLLALALSALLAAATAPDGGGWTYRSDFGGAASPQFVSSDDTILVYELRLAPYQEQIRFLSADGAILSQAPLTHRGRRMPYEFVLVDQWHVALPMEDPPRIGLVPEDTSPSATAQAFLSWAEASGGIIQRISLEASTNPHADLSCAIGADGSIAVWRTVGAFQFQASSPNAISLADNMVAEVFCLEAQGRSYAAVHLIDERFEVPHRSWLRIYEAGVGTPVADFPLRLENISYLLHGHVAGPGLLLGMTSARAMDQEEWTWIATRISFADDQWRIERARLTGDWPQGFRVMRAQDILLAPDDMTQEMVSVPWPGGETSIPYAPQPFMAQPPGFPGPYSISPTGRLSLWTNRRDAIRVTRTSP